MLPILQFCLYEVSQRQNANLHVPGGAEKKNGEITADGYKDLGDK